MMCLEILALAVLAYLSDDPTMFLLGAIIAVSAAAAAILLYHRWGERKGKW